MIPAAAAIAMPITAALASKPAGMMPDYNPVSQYAPQTLTAAPISMGDDSPLLVVNRSPLGGDKWQDVARVGLLVLGVVLVVKLWRKA